MIPSVVQTEGYVCLRFVYKNSAVHDIITKLQITDSIIKNVVVYRKMMLYMYFFISEPK